MTTGFLFNMISAIVVKYIVFAFLVYSLFFNLKFLFLEMTSIFKRCFIMYLYYCFFIYPINLKSYVTIFSSVELSLHSCNIFWLVMGCTWVQFNDFYI